MDKTFVFAVLKWDRDSYKKKISPIIFPEDNEKLIYLVGRPRIQKGYTFSKDAYFHKAIPVRDRLAIPLQFLASGDSFTSSQYFKSKSKQRIGIIVIETGGALIECVKYKKR